jgi:hypothetical protein
MSGARATPAMPPSRRPEDAPAMAGRRADGAVRRWPTANEPWRSITTGRVSFLPATADDFAEGCARPPAPLVTTVALASHLHCCAPPHLGCWPCCASSPTTMMRPHAREQDAARRGGTAEVSAVGRRWAGHHTRVCEDHRCAGRVVSSAPPPLPSLPQLPLLDSVASQAPV